MSLSRPVQFPLFKLLWLCIKSVLQNSEEFDIIYFATISNRTRRIVKYSNYPLKEIDIYPSRSRRISVGDLKEKIENQKNWFFWHIDYPSDDKLVLQRGSQPFFTSREYYTDLGHCLFSYNVGDELDALKMGIEFMTDVFGCTIRYIIVDGNKLAELFGLSINTVKVLHINDPGPVSISDLEYLLETIKVTDEYVFDAPIPEDFKCDPQIFKCRQMSFKSESSADWVTLELLCQFDVPQLIFEYHQFSVEDIVSYITRWFNSENHKLEYVHFEFNNPSLEDFKIDHLKPMSFCEKRRNRYILNVKGWEKTDISSGMDILRQDGLLATLHAFSTSILFYVWHKRFPDAVQQ